MLASIDSLRRTLSSQRPALNVIIVSIVRDVMVEEKRTQPYDVVKRQQS